MACKSHHWIIKPNNKGKCKLCGAERDFNKANKQAFPGDYLKGFPAKQELTRSLAPAEYYMQGSLPKSDGFGMGMVDIVYKL